MDCATCQSLAEARDSRMHTYIAARELLDASVATTNREEYSRLLIATENARLELTQAQNKMDGHARAHSVETAEDGEPAEAT